MDYREEIPTHLKPWVDRAQQHWDNLDMDALKPIVHGPAPTEEELAARAAMLRQAEENMRRYAEQPIEEESKR